MWNDALEHLSKVITLVDLPRDNWLKSDRDALIEAWAYLNKIREENKIESNRQKENVGRVQEEGVRAAGSTTEAGVREQTVPVAQTTEDAVRPGSSK
jgi:hypothetical protein